MKRQLEGLTATAGIKLVKEEEHKHDITKKTDIEHILYAGAMYVGQDVHTRSPPVSRFVYNRTKHAMEFQENFEYPHGLLKIFDEAIVNAADIVHRGAKNIKIGINRLQNAIYVWNDGPNFPVVESEHPSLWNPDAKAYKAELAFFHCKSSSAYTNKKRITGGVNGYGIKLASIFAKWSTLEMSDGETYYYQKSSNHMTEVHAPLIKKEKAGTKPYVAFCFSPDLSLFYPPGEAPNVFSDAILDLFATRAIDLAGTLPKEVKVMWSLTLDQFIAPKICKFERLPVKGFKDYLSLYLPLELKEQLESDGKNLKIGYFSTPRWEVCLIKNPYSFPINVSFVNNINTYQGGEHVKYIQSQLLQFCRTKIEGIDIRRVAGSVMLFVNATIENPSFNSQSKESLKTTLNDFGSVCELPAKFFSILTRSGVIESLKSGMDEKQIAAVRKTFGAGKTKNVYDIPNFRDARFAGTRKSDQCTLYVVEGVSALELAEVGISVLGNDYTGAMPVKGKILNVDADMSKIEKNEELKYICKALGLEVGKATPFEKLRYGKVVLMTDSDQDGSHIRGLFLYLIAKFWPHLMREQHQFIYTMITPIVVATRSKTDVQKFYTIQSFEKWHNPLTEKQKKSWELRYYKGLASSTTKEGRFYFQHLRDHLKNFVKAEPQDFSELELVFGKKNAEHRRQWLDTYDAQSYIDYDAIKELSVYDFLNKDMKHFSMTSVKRGLSMVEDGLTVAARKCIWVFLQRKLVKDTKVATAQSWVDADTNYHHAPDSLGKTIVRLSQMFVGKQNMNFFVPVGQFGTRRDGGQTFGSTRYIFTKISPLTRYLFREEDDHILTEQIDEDHVIEPLNLAPIIPLILVNGSSAISTGYSSQIPCYRPEDLITRIRSKLSDEPWVDLTPWYHKFVGEIKSDAQGNYESIGKVKQIDATHWNIIELPVGTWREPYKAMLTKMVRDDKIVEFHEQHRNEDVCFEVTLTHELKLDPITFFKLRRKYSSQLNLLLSNGADLKIKVFPDVVSIFNDWFDYRLRMYEVRRKHQLLTLQKSIPFLTAKVNFIRIVLDNQLPLGKKKHVLHDVMSQLMIPAEFHDALLRMNLSSFTEERIIDINKELSDCYQKIEFYSKVAPKNLWFNDLDELSAQLPAFWSSRVVEDDDDDDDEPPKPKKKSNKRK